MIVPCINYRRIRRTQPSKARFNDLWFELAVHDDVLHRGTILRVQIVDVLDLAQELVPYAVDVDVAHRTVGLLIPNIEDGTVRSVHGSDDTIGRADAAILDAIGEVRSSLGGHAHADFQTDEHGRDIGPVDQYTVDLIEYIGEDVGLPKYRDLVHAGDVEIDMEDS